MRKALIALLLIITAFSAFTANAAENLSGYSSRCCGGYYAGYKDNKAFCLNIKSGNNILYTFDGEVSTVAMHHSKLYAVTKSGQNGRYNVIIMSGKSQTKSFSVEAELGNNCKAAVDKNGNLCALDCSGKLCRFDTSGRRLTNTDGYYTHVFTLSDRVYLADGSGIYLLSNPPVKLMNRARFGNLFEVSESCLGDDLGNIYNVKSKTRSVFPSGQTGFAESKSFFVCDKGGKLCAYGKTDGELKGSAEIGSKASAVYAEGKNIYAVVPNNGGFLVRSFTEDDLVPKQKSEELSAAESFDVPDKVDLSMYKLRDGYLILPDGITKAELSKSVKPSGSVTYVTTGNLKTGGKLKITSGKESCELTAVIMGDIAPNGIINSYDKRLLFDRLLGFDNLSKAQFYAADLNSDGKTTNADLVLLDRLLTGYGKEN